LAVGAASSTWAGLVLLQLGWFRFGSTGLLLSHRLGFSFALWLRLGFLFGFDWVFSFASTGLIFFCFNWAFLLLQLGFSFASAGLFLSLQLGRASTELFFFRFDRAFFFRLYWAFFLRFNCAFSSFDLSLLRLGFFFRFNLAFLLSSLFFCVNWAFFRFD
jgi:hypothetical protein